MDSQWMTRLGTACRLARLALILGALAALTIPATPAIAAPGDIGYQGHSFAGTSTPSTPTGAKRNESLLWFNDGRWWAHMWDAASQDYHIFKLDTATQTWSDSGTLTDPRITSHGDVLWDGNKLYVASHVFVNDGLPAAPGFDSHLYRYSYNTATDTYSLDPGFPVVINNYKSETLVIEKDSTGKLWATWQQGDQIYVNSTQGNDQTWGTPFPLLVGGANVNVDDNSSLVAFGGNKLGIMWSNKSTPEADGFYFSIHNDGAPDTSWSASTRAVSGARSSDDHINLKALSDGRVLAAVKTERTGSSEPLTQLLVRNPATGAWSAHTTATVADCPNRPSVLVDEQNDTIHVLQTAPAPPDFACNSTGGAIYQKTSSLSSISFAPGRGQLVILDADSPAVHNVTSTKQGLSGATGLAALAINAATKFYWHHYEQVAPPPPAAPVANFTGTPTSGNAPLTVSFTDTSTGNPTSWSWNFGDGTSSTARNPSHTYTRGGTYTVSLTVGNASGSNTKTITGYVTVRDFTVTASPGNRYVLAGQSTTYDVTVVGWINNWAGTVALSVDGLPSGTTASFSRSSVTVPPAGSSTLTINTSLSTPTGDYGVRIIGRSGSVTRRTTVRLQVSNLIPIF